MGADRNQWQFPRNEADKVLGWRSDGRGMENKGPFQDQDPNLTTLAGVTPGVSGLAMLAAATNPAAWDALNVSGAVADKAALQAIDIVDGLSVIVLSQDGGLFVGDTSVITSLTGPDIASSAVDSATDTITSAGHGLMTGQAVIVTATVNGLSVNTIYYVISPVDDDDDFQLAASFADAHAGTAVDLTGTDAMTVKQHYDPLQGVYVCPASDLNGAAGAWVRQLDGGKLTARMFGAAGDNATDDSHAWCAAADYVRAGRNAGEGIVYRQVDGEGLFYKHLYSLNFTGISGRGASFVNAIFNSCCEDDIALDFTASQFVHVDRFTTTGDQTLTPDVGMFFGRADDGSALPFPTAQDNDLGAIETLGTFKKSGFMNAASEVMHIDTLTSSNAYHSPLSTGSVFAGHTDVIENFCGMPVSKYQKIALGSQSLSSVIIDNHNARRNPSYGYEITGMSATNPVVVTIASADASAGQIANGSSVFLDRVVGSNAAWAALLSFKVFAVANLDTGAGTFELSGVDGTGLTGTFTSGTLRNNTGPATALGQLGLYKEGGGYQTSYSDAAYRYDATQDADWNWNVVLSGRHETAADHLVKIIGNGLTNHIRHLSIESDNSASRVSPISVTGVTGSGKVSIDDLQVKLGHAAQTPTSGMFDDPSVVRLNGGRISVPDSSFVNSRASFDFSSARWEFGGVVRDDGTGMLAQSAVSVSHTGSTTETTLATVTIPGGYMTENARVVVKTLWSFTGSVNIKTMKVKLNTTAYLNQVTSTGTQVAARHVTEINAVNSMNSQKGGPYALDGYGEIALPLTTSTFNMANDQDITITAQLANSGETVTLEAYSVEVIQG